MSLAPCFVSRLQKMVSFELGKEIEKYVFLCPRLVTRRKNISLFLYRALKLTILLSLLTKHSFLLLRLSLTSKKNLSWCVCYVFVQFHLTFVYTTCIKIVVIMLLSTF